ncbi:MAG TPA: DUF2244 domain-containing protein [Beijerinckiaceae bacterium]|nr:DUF2244 domain-containing protein [Beijerinckiaceae bacterium]
MSNPFEARIFEARLVPHRSLDRRGVFVVLACVGSATSLLSLPFFLMGAWPVIGFMGLDVLALWLALRASFRSARAYEDVRLSALELEVAKVSAAGARREWQFNPLWVRLERIEDEEFGIAELSLASRGRRLVIASFLGPQAKADFARDLSRALAQARRGPQFS